MAEPAQRDDEAELLRRIQFGSEADKLAAFSALVGWHEPQLLRHLRWKGLTPEECDDVANETWGRAWVAVRRFQQRGSALYPWLRTIADHVCSELFRHRYLGRSLDDVAAVAADPDDPIAALIAVHSAEEIRHAIRRLLADAPADYQNVIEFGFFEDLTNAEIMDLCEWSADKLYVTRFRALRWLKRRLTRAYGASTLTDWRGPL